MKPNLPEAGSSGIPGAGQAFEDLLALIEYLRGPHGCPWDREQTHESLRPYVLEEAYELVEVIDQLKNENTGDRDKLQEELGDLLLQVVLHAQIAREAAWFDARAVVDTLAEKLIRRHPHVFGDARASTPEEVAVHWERVKAEERRAEGGGTEGGNAHGKAGTSGRPRAPGTDAHDGEGTRVGKGDPGQGEKGRGEKVTEGAETHGGEDSAAGAVKPSVLDGVSRALPALQRAQELQIRAAGLGFDWETADEAMAKVWEEMREVRQARKEGSQKRVEEELGDVLFAAINVIRLLGVNAEVALTGASRRFADRFRYMEQESARRGRPLEEMTLEELNSLWEAGKQSR